MNSILKLGVAMMIVIAALITILFFYLISQGLVKKITVVEQELGPYHFVFLEHQGDYAKLDKTFKEVIEAFTLANLSYEKLVGAYLDDPKWIAKENLRSAIGVVISASDYQSKTYPKGMKKKSFLNNST